MLISGQTSTQEAGEKHGGGFLRQFADWTALGEQGVHFEEREDEAKEWRDDRARGDETI